MSATPALDKFNEFAKSRYSPADLPLYIYYLLEAVCERSVRQINVNGKIFEIYADVVETEE